MFPVCTLLTVAHTITLPRRTVTCAWYHHSHHHARCGTARSCTACQIYNVVAAFMSSSRASFFFMAPYVSSSVNEGKDLHTHTLTYVCFISCRLTVVVCRVKQPTSSMLSLSPSTSQQNRPHRKQAVVSVDSLCVLIFFIAVSALRVSLLSIAVALARVCDVHNAHGSVNKNHS